MCIQSYYNQKDNGENEIDLDLLKEIRDVGIDEWNEQVSKKAREESAGNNEDR